MKKKIRNEQKGLLFIVFILLVAAILFLVFSFALRTNVINDVIERDTNLKTLFIVEDED